MALIERETAIALIEQKQKELCPLGKFSRHSIYGSDRDKFDSWQKIIDDLEGIPAIAAMPVVHGRWIDNGEALRHCSACGAYCFPYNYCPDCGARMDGGEGHEAG